MDAVNAWTGAILGVAAVVGTGVATLRWLVATLTRQMRVVAHDVVSDVVSEALAASERRLSARFERIDERFDAVDRRLDAVDRRLDAVDRRLDAIDRRFDALDSRVDHIAEVVDLRLRPLEADMGLVKQHLLGSPAA